MWMATQFLCLFVVCLCVCLQTGLSKPPNIVFVLTDDQDVVLGGVEPMTKTKKYIGNAGIIFDNMFVNSPLCCPSRSSILTGKYNHNYQALNNSLSGNCSSPTWQLTQETKAFVTHLKLRQYQTFFAGKYLNQYGNKGAGGVEHIPPGWDHWYGLVGNSVYYNYTLSVNGKAETHGSQYPHDYLTEVINRKAMKFLEGYRDPSKPFFMMLSTPACHEPFTPAPQYKGNFSDLKAPRNGSFNVYGKDKHWLIREAKHPMSDDAVSYIDQIYRERLRTLLSVDDMVESVYEKVRALGEINNTYFVFSSDNGYHLGQFSLVMDKRQMYETDIRVPLMVSGPGIKPGQRRKELVMNIDLGPTFIDLAGGTPPATMDGVSIKPLLQAASNSTVNKWRTDGLIEHVGEHVKSIQGCPQYTDQNMANCEEDCVCNDAMNNTYACLRIVSTADNMIVCQFSDSQDFMEVYDMNTDPHQLKNIAAVTDPKKLVVFNDRLIKLMFCSGLGCRTLPDNRKYNG